MPLTTPANAMSANTPDVFAGLGDDQLLTPGEVANRLRVDPKTVTRWANARRISSVRTPGGHRRFYVKELRRMLQQEG